MLISILTIDMKSLRRLNSQELGEILKFCLLSYLSVVDASVLYVQ
jgi:hypothetical protein